MRPSARIKRLGLLAGVPLFLVGLTGLGPASRVGAAPSRAEATSDRRRQPDPGVPGRRARSRRRLLRRHLLRLHHRHPLGNHLQALVDTTGDPRSGWRSYTGLPYGSTALPVTPSWETPNTQTSPGVFSFDGRWIMFYDASVDPYPADSGHSCLSVATAASLSPGAPVFTDTSTGPLYCAPGGVLDPSPFVDPATGAAYLVWKSNDGSSAEPSQIWSVQLGADGTSFFGTPTVLLAVDQAALPWETTVDDPQLVSNSGTYDLLFSAGNFESAGYAEALTTCSGPLGPCTSRPTPS